MSGPGFTTASGLVGPLPRTKLLYLAHPVAGGLFWPALGYLRAFNAALNPHGYAVVCPWLPQVMTACSDSNTDARAFWLGIDMQHVAAYDGVVACGTHLSGGVKLECAYAHKLDKPVYYVHACQPDAAVRDLLLDLGLGHSPKTVDYDNWVPRTFPKEDQ